VAGNYVGTVPSNLENPVFPGAPTNFVGSNNLIDGDAKLGALAYYGGPLQTMMPASDSLAHGTGTTTVPGIPTTDQSGNLRPAQPAIGAMEGSYSLTVTTAESYGLTPGEVSLQEAVHRANLIPGANTIEFSSLFDTSQTVLLHTPVIVTDPAATTLDGQDRLTIQGDGGIRVKNGSLALSGVTLSGGSVQLHNSNGNVALSGVTVTGNSVKKLEAVIQNGGQDPSVLYVKPLFSGLLDPYTQLPVQLWVGGTRR
jgi:hypothetical protein